MMAVVMIALGILFVRMAQFEGKSGLLWGALSCAASALSMFGYGFFGLFGNQLILFAAFALYVNLKPSRDRR
ncbi:MAG: hypothetical protein V3W41_15630 [Planctomycetota bacterium]